MMRGIRLDFENLSEIILRYRLCPYPISPWKTEQTNHDVPALISAAKRLRIRIKRELDLAERRRNL